jgi:predicted metal-dependent hydrolase
VRESPRARHLRLTVAPSRPVDLVVPRGVRAGEVERFLADRRGWIAEKLALVQARAAAPFQLGLDRPGVVWLGGEPVPVRRLPGARGRAALVDGTLELRGDDAAALGALQRWYPLEAHRRLTVAADAEAAALGLAYAALSVRDQRSRWGSCSTAGRLSFSWRLVLAPPAILDYVVVHELCHLRHPDHSRAFWSLVEAARPDWRAASGWLREHGRELHAYDLAAALRSP